MKENQKDFFVVLGRSSTKKILEFLDSHDNVKLGDLTHFATSFALKRLFQELMEFNLIECHVQMDDEKKVWYELTEKGTKILQALRELERILRSSHTRVGDSTDWIPEDSFTSRFPPPSHSSQKNGRVETNHEGGG